MTNHLESIQPSSSDIATIEDNTTSGVYVKRDITIVRGRGATLWDDQGREYIDCIGGQGASNLGHAHPAVIQAITSQAENLISCPEMFHNDKRARLQQKLIAIAPGNINRVFLCNSGTEAVEAAIKFSRFSTGKTGIIAFMRGFHGRTMGALSATWNKKYRQPFEPLVPNFSHTPYNNLERLEEIISEDTAAVIIEIIQGEGGVHIGEPKFLRGAQRLCRQNGTLLIVDEVQTGFGRTGKMFAFEHYDLDPDLVCLAKSIAGGVPMGAVLIGKRVVPLKPGLHGSTFGGNPLACAAALASIGTLESHLINERTDKLGKDLLNKLKKIESPLIREARGLGLMVGIELKSKVAPYIRHMMERGVLALTAGMTVIRLLPPLVISIDQINQVVDTLEEVLQ